MLLRRLYVFFIVLLVITASFHLLKKLDEHSRMSQMKELQDLTHATNSSVQSHPPVQPRLLKTPLLLGYGAIKGRGSFRRTQAQIVGRRRGRSRDHSL